MICIFNSLLFINMRLPVLQSFVELFGFISILAYFRLIPTSAVQLALLLPLLLQAARRRFLWSSVLVNSHEVKSTVPVL